MATFHVQVEGMTGLAIDNSSTPTEDELTQFLRDGVIEVQNRCLAAVPEEAMNFLRVSAEQTSNNSLDLNGAKIVSVVREAEVNDDWRECRPIYPSLQNRVTDKTSIHYASSYNPAYTVLENGKVSVFPTPGASTKAFKAYYVNNVPVDKGEAALLHSHSDIGFFDDSKVYLVVLYASIKALEHKMGFYSHDDEDIELVQGIVANINSLKQQYEAAFAAMYPQKQQGGR
tara:strand:+ start:573 stop:1259 length:687 start_codon:yes stop_codon:yes gene_type:complete